MNMGVKIDSQTKTPLGLLLGQFLLLEYYYWSDLKGHRC